MNEQLEEQAALYALELLEPAEHAAFEAELGKSEELRGYVEMLRGTAAQMAHAAPDRKLPPELEARVLAALRSVRPIPMMAATRESSSFNWLPWALAACLAIACVLLANDRAQTKKRLASLESSNVAAQMQIAVLSSQLSSAPKATAVVVWDAEKQQGVLKVTNVPANDPERDYQLWIVDPDYKQPVDAGVFSVADAGTEKISFKPKSRINSATAFAVSLERKGGVPKAEGPMVLLGK